MGCFGNAKVNDLGSALISDDDIFRGNISVHDVQGVAQIVGFVMGILETTGHFADDVQCMNQGDGGLFLVGLVLDFSYILSIEKFHGDVVMALLFAYIKDIDDILKHIDDNKSLKYYNDKLSTSKAEFFSTKCDVIIPAALELQILEKEANNIDCKLIVEAANGPINIAADNIFKSKNIDVIPDILANSGGVLVSYFEWLQNKTNEYLDEDDINLKLEKKMNKTFNDVFNISKQYNCTLREASYIKSLQKLENTYLSRGFI